MNAAVCAGALACSAALVAAASVTTPPSSTATGLVGDASSFSAPATISAAPEEGDAASAPAYPGLCDPALDAACNTLAPDGATDKVYHLPAPSGDPVKDLATLQAAVKDTRYDTIEGASNGQRLSYDVNGMLEIDRSLTIRNLELHQKNTGYVVRTIYAQGGGTPITLRLENVKIERGPAGSEATGSVSDSAGIWTVNTTPEFANVELYGGGHGDGVQIVNATGGHLVDVYVHDITWTPYPDDQKDQNFWPSFTLATLQAQNNWNYFQILDYNGHALTRKRIEEQANGIVLDRVYNLALVRPRVERLQTRFSDGQVYPYQTDGITIVTGNGITIRDAKVTHVAEGMDMPAFPNLAIDVDNSTVSDAPLFCFKTRGSYDSRNFSIAAGSTNVVTVRNSTGTNCGMAAFYSAGGAQAYFENTRAVDTGMGPDGTTSPGIGGVAAYRFMQSSALPTLDAGSAPIGMHILNATVQNPHSTYMQTVFHSENDPSDPRTQAVVQAYTVSNPSQPKVPVSHNFTSVSTNPVAQAALVVASATVEGAASGN
jgi:hypothetical protein